MLNCYDLTEGGEVGSVVALSAILVCLYIHPMDMHATVCSSDVAPLSTPNQDGRQYLVGRWIDLMASSYIDGLSCLRRRRSQHTLALLTAA